MPTQKVASAYVDLQLQTAQFKAAIGEATNSMKAFSAQTKEEMGKSRESIRLLSEELHLGIPRGLQGIISKLPGVSTALTLAFDSVVVFALIDVVVKVTEKVSEFVKKNEEAAKKSAEGWKDITKSIRDINSELTLSNSRIQDSIAKLEHKPGQGLKTALLEAADAAQKLSDKLDQDIDKILKLTTERKIGALDELAGNGQDDIDRTIGYGAKQAQKITTQYQGMLNRAAASGDQKNYDQIRQDEIAALHKALDPQVATLGDYLRQHQDLAETNPNDPRFTKARAGYDTLTGVVSATEDQAQEEKGKHSQKGLEIAKDDADEAKRKLEADKRQADLDLALHQRQVALDQATQNNNQAAQYADPKWLEQQKIQESQAAAPNMEKWLAGQVELNKKDPKQGMTAEQARRISEQLIPELLKVEQERLSAANQAGSVALNSATTQFDTEQKRLQIEAQDATTKAVEKLGEITDKGEKALLEAMNHYSLAVDKQLLHTGQITQTEFQRRRVGDLEQSAARDKQGIADALPKQQQELSQGLVRNIEEQNRSLDRLLAVPVGLNPEQKAAQDALDTEYMNKLIDLKGQQREIYSWEAARKNDDLTKSRIDFTTLQASILNKGGGQAQVDDAARASTEALGRQNAVTTRIANAQLTTIDRRVAALESSHATTGPQVEANAAYSRAKTDATAVEIKRLQDEKDHLNQQLAVDAERATKTIDVNLDTEKFESGLMAKHSQAMGGVNDVFDEFIARSRDAGTLIHGIFTEALNSVNDALVKLITTKREPGQNPFVDAGKSIATSVAKTGLETAEGNLMKLLGLGSKKPLSDGGTVELGGRTLAALGASGLVKAAGLGSSGSSTGKAAGGIFGSLLNVLNDSNWASSLFGGNLFGAGSFFGGHAAGGVMSPGDWSVVGENGPELAHFGGGARIYSNRDSAAMLNGGGTTHNWSIDARGSNDPAAVHMAVQRGIRQAAPTIIAAGHAAQKEAQRRTPSMGR